MTFHPLAAVTDLHDGYRQVFQLQGRDLLLLQHAGAVYVVDNICPHAGYPMVQSQVIDGALRCPMHGYLFRITDGACLAAHEGPCRDLQTWPVAIREGQAGVML